MDQHLERTKIRQDIVAVRAGVVRLEFEKAFRRTATVRHTVRDANGVTVAWLYCRDDSQRYSFGASKLTSEEARRIGKAISRIPEFTTQRQGFHQRGGGATLTRRPALSCRARGHLHSRRLG